MANKFDEILGGAGNNSAPSGDARPPGRPIMGSFYCQFCGVEVDEAQYYPTESLLVWKCEEKHSSYIEGFDLM